MKMRFALLLLAAALCAGCSSGFQPLKAKPVVATRNRPLPPENPVYGVPSYEAPMVWVAEDPDDVKGSTRNVEPRPEPAREILAQAMVAEEIGDTETLLARLHEAADAGNARAHYELARHYLTGEGVAADQAAALDHLSQADALGSAEASRVLAWNYLRGTGVQQDVEYGTRLMEKAARTSDRALREISLLYLNTCEPYLNDPQRGLALLKVASDAGDSVSAPLYQLALRQQQGQPIETSVAQAHEPLPCLAPSIAAPAERDATAIALNAEPAENEAAAEATKLAALSGDLDAMVLYAEKLLSGEYPSTQPELESYTWFAVAASRGSGPAAERTASLAPILQSAEQRQPGLVDSMIAALDSAIQPPRQHVQ